MAAMRSQDDMDPTGWQRVWAAVEARATELGWTRSRLYDETEVSETTYSAMRRHGQPIVKPAKIAIMCRALGWEAGSVDAILEGGQPTVADRSPPADEIKQRLERIERLVQLLVQGQEVGIQSVLKRIDDLRAEVRPPIRRRAAQ